MEGRFDRLEGILENITKQLPSETQQDIQLGPIQEMLKNISGQFSDSTGALVGLLSGAEGKSYTM